MAKSKRKRPAFIFALILFGFCGHTQNLPMRFEVKYVCFRIETPFSINPTEFDSVFSNCEYSICDLDQHDSGSSIVYSYLTQFRKVRPQSVDTRLKIIYSMKNIERVMWMNKFGIFTDGETCYKNNNLYNILLKTLSPL